MVLACVAAPLPAQDRTVAREAEFRDAPTGPLVAMLAAGTRVRRQDARAGHTRVIVEGFVEGAQLGGRKGRYQVHVSASAGAILRTSADPSATAVGTLTNGVGLAVLLRTGKWVKVRRGGWLVNAAFTAVTSTTASPVARGSVPAPVAPAGSRGSIPPVTASTSAAAALPAAASAPLVAVPATPAPPLPEGTLVTARSSELRTAPDGGAAIGSAAKDVMLTPLARERGWVRVRIEGWVRERDVMPADSLARSAVSAADLRADPLGSRGRIVRWEVEIVAFQVADPLRHDLTPDEPYLLARGPGRENALLYLAIPPSLVAQARALPPLAPVIITARVRTGKSNPTGVPVLDLQQLSRK